MEAYLKAFNIIFNHSVRHFVPEHCPSLTSSWSIALAGGIGHLLPEPALRGDCIGMMLLWTVLLLEEHIVVVEKKKMRHPPQPLPPVGMRVVSGVRH